jgi:hypothetical protein
MMVRNCKIIDDIIFNMVIYSNLSYDEFSELNENTSIFYMVGLFINFRRQIDKYNSSNQF